MKETRLWMVAILMCGLSCLVISCSVEDSPAEPVGPEPSDDTEFLNKMRSLDWGTDTCFVYGHKTPDVDAVTSALAYARLMRALGFNCKAKVSSAMNRETEYAARIFGFELPELKTSVAPQTRLIVTDHSEYAQCVDGARDAIILQKIDHHDDGDISDDAVPFVRREIVGSACSLVYQCYKDARVDIDDEAASIILAGIVSDTRNLSKGFTSLIDSTAYFELSAQLGLSKDSLSAINRIMKGAKYDHDGMTDVQILCSDMKEYTIGGLSVAMGSLDFRQPGLDDFLDSMLAAMVEVQADKHYDMVFAKIDEHIPNTGKNKDKDPYLDGGTYFVYYGVGAKAVSEAVFGPSLREGVCLSEKKISRKEIVPLITEAILRN